MQTRILYWTGPLVGFIVAFFAVRALTSGRQISDAPVPREMIAEEPVESEAVKLDPVELVPVDAQSAGTLSPLAGNEGPAAGAAPTSTELGSPPAAGHDAGVLLYGMVADAMGQPIDQAYMTVEMPTGERIGAKSDDLGRYSLGPLPVGQWLLSASLRNHHEERIEVGLPPGLATKRQDLVLRPKQVVRVRLSTRAGKPAIPALIAAGHSVFQLGLVPVATSSDPGLTFTEVSGSLNNRFGIGSFGEPGFIGPDQEFPDEYGAVTLHKDGPAWISLVVSHQVLAKQRVQPSDEWVTLTLDPEQVSALTATVRATVLDAVSGEALEATASLGNEPFFNSGAKFGTDASTGALVIDDALPGRKWLIIDSLGRASVKREVRVIRGAVLELGEIVMHEPISIDGSISDAGGAPLESVIKWGVLDEASGTVTWATQRITQSAPDGSFVIRELEPAIYVVWSPGPRNRSSRARDARRASRAARVDARTKSVAEVELILLPTSRVTLVTGEPAGAYAVARVLDAEGIPSRPTSLGRYGPEAHLELVEGTYTLEVTRNGEELIRRTLKVDGNPQRIEFDIGAN